MGVTEILTIIFVILKLFGLTEVAEWSWFKCFIPELISMSVYLIFVIIWVFLGVLSGGKK